VGGFLAFVAIFALQLSSRFFTDIIHNLDQATRLQTHMSRWVYLATQFRVIATYLRLLLFPVGQRLDYDYPLYTSFFNLEVLLSGALLCALFGIAVYSLCRSRRSDENKSVLLRVIAFGIFWFFISLMIESSIIPIIDVIFEHRMYLPSVGLFMALAAFLSLAAGADAWIPGWPQKRIVAGVAFMLLLLAGTTFTRNLLWCDEVAFWEDNAVKSPGKARVFTNLGLVLEKKGNFDGAIAAYRRAIKLDPKRTDALLDLGTIYTQKGWLDDALAQFKAALKIIPDQSEAYNNIGKVYGIRFQLDEALMAFQQALKINPTRPEPYNNIGRIYFIQGHYDEGLQKIKQCLALDPLYEPAYINRGMALQSQGRYREARADFLRALKINPSDENAAALVRQIDDMH
jgi:tetratricopeptide (TPR) repeat protein